MNDRTGQVVSWKSIKWILDLRGQVYTLKAFGLGGGATPRLGKAMVLC